jgi:hypothetical protein
MQCREDRVDHGIELRLDVTIPKPQHTVTGRSQEAVPPLVVGRTFEMLTAIQFDDEPPIERGEVADVEADLVLSAELETADLAATETAPEESFGICLAVTKIADVAKHARIGQ